MIKGRGKATKETNVKKVKAGSCGVSKPTASKTINTKKTVAKC